MIVSGPSLRDLVSELPSNKLLSHAAKYTPGSGLFQAHIELMMASYEPVFDQRFDPLIFSRLATCH